MVYATKMWRHYLLGKPVLMRTDHKPLLQTLHLEHMKSRHHRWEEQLQLYDIKLEYKLEKFHIIPDALSRRLDYKELSSSNMVTAISMVEPHNQCKMEYQQKLKADPFFHLVRDRLMTKDGEYNFFSLKDGLLYHGQQVYVPSDP